VNFVVLPSVLFGFRKETGNASPIGQDSDIGNFPIQFSLFLVTPGQAAFGDKDIFPWPPGKKPGQPRKAAIRASVF
jgi:hypothetical protein